MVWYARGKGSLVGRILRICDGGSRPRSAGSPTQRRGSRCHISQLLVMLTLGGLVVLQSAGWGQTVSGSPQAGAVTASATLANGIHGRPLGVLQPAHSYFGGPPPQRLPAESEMRPFTRGENVSVSFAPNQSSGLAPLEVRFQASLANVTGLWELQWNFGDGAFCPNCANSGANHTYFSSGNFSVSLRLLEFSSSPPYRLVANLSGGSTVIRVAGDAASFGATALRGEAPLTVSFQAHLDPGVGIAPLQFHWFYGDRQACDLCIEPSITHVYTSPGVYIARLWIIDSHNVNISAGALTVIVNPSLTVFLFSSPRGGFAPLTVNFNVTSLGGVPPISYYVSFGDGHGCSPCAGANLTHVFQGPGSWLTQLYAIDSVGSTAQPSL